MFDPYSAALHAAGARSASAPALVFCAGLLTSVGPCVAPRFIAAAGLSSGTGRFNAAIRTGAFVCGLAFVYASFGFAASMLSRAVAAAPLTYAIVACTLVFGGLRALWNGAGCKGHHSGERAHGGAGAAFLLGGSFAFVVSPCCAPLVMGIVSLTAGGDPAYAAMLLSCFAFGHALPILPVAAGANSLAATFRRAASGEAGSVISATLMLGLGAYYAVLA